MSLLLGGLVAACLPSGRAHADPANVLDRQYAVLTTDPGEGFFGVHDTHTDIFSRWDSVVQAGGEGWPLLTAPRGSWVVLGATGLLDAISGVFHAAATNLRNGWLRTAAVSPDGRFVGLLLDRWRGLTVFDARTGTFFERNFLDSIEWGPLSPSPWSIMSPLAIDADGRLYVGGATWVPDCPICNRLGDPGAVWVVDIESGRFLRRIDLPSSPLALRYDSESAELVLVTTTSIDRFETRTGEHVSTVPINLRNTDVVIVTQERVLAQAGTRLNTYDPTSGQKLEELVFPRTIGEVWTVDDSGTAFATILGVNGQTVQIAHIDVAPLAFLSLFDAPNSGWHSVAIVPVPKDWEPARTLTPWPTRTQTATRTSRATSTPTPTLGPRGTPTPIPSPTPCAAPLVDIDLPDVSALPGASVEVRLHVQAHGSCAEALSVSLVGDEELRIDSRSNRQPVCTTSTLGAPGFSSFPTNCTTNHGPCSSIAFSLYGPGGRNSRGLPLPPEFTITCRFVVGRDSAPGSHLLVAEARTQYAYTASLDSRHFGRVVVDGAALDWTATPTATLTSTTRPTRTPTAATVADAPAPTPCAVGCPSLELRSNRFTAGKAAVVQVFLRAAGAEIVALQNDLTMPTAAASWRCRGNPFLAHRVSFQEQACASASCTRLRVIVLGANVEATPIPEGALLYTCRVPSESLDQSAFGRWLVSRAYASTAAGRRLSLAAANSGD